MPSTPTLRRTRPNSAPAYYLGRSASFWITTTRHTGAPGADCCATLDLDRQQTV
jgi:hypothetical protein